MRRHYEAEKMVFPLNVMFQIYKSAKKAVVVDSDWPFDNLCGSHLQSQSEL